MKILANDFKKQWAECAQDVVRAVTRTGESGWYVLGSEVSAFEASLANYVDTPFAIGCGNGMDALEISLRSLGIGPGDKVLTTSLSAFATGLAILRAGAEPVYCDVDAHGLLDPERAEQALKEHPAIRAIIPVHLFGHMADTEALQQIAKPKGVWIIEDAAQAIGAERHGSRVGAIGQTTCYSFYPTKNLGAIGDGGALTTKDADLNNKALCLRNYGQGEKYVHDMVGLNSRLDELQAAILNTAFLPRLPTWTNRRRQIAQLYLDGINNPKVTLCPGPDPRGAVWHLFPVLVAPNSRAQFMADLAAAGIQTGIHYPKLISEQRAMSDRGSVHLSGGLERAQAFADGEVSLPIHPFLSDEDISHVIDTVNGWAS